MAVPPIGGQLWFQREWGREDEIVLRDVINEESKNKSTAGEKFKK